jgi:hypothetical protein
VRRARFGLVLDSGGSVRFIASVSASAGKVTRSKDTVATVASLTSFDNDTRGTEAENKTFKLNLFTYLKIIEKIIK